MKGLGEEVKQGVPGIESREQWERGIKINVAEGLYIPVAYPTVQLRGVIVCKANSGICISSE